jgi:hypothetical protein
MATWSRGSAIGDPELEACRIQPARLVRAALRESFDVVASTCLLSQLIDSVVDAVGTAHPRFQELFQAVRVGHLRLLMDLISPGGAGILITDLVSSDTVPNLTSVPPDRLQAVLAQCIDRGNIFYGVAPHHIEAAYRNDPMLSAETGTIEFSPPWLWNPGPRTYAVYAAKIEKRAHQPR